MNYTDNNEIMVIYQLAVILYSSTCHNENRCSEPTTVKVSKDVLPKQTHNELLSMKWQLSVKWRKEHVYYGDSLRLAPCVKMVPDPDIEEKLGDVKILPGYTTLVSGNKKKKMLAPSKPGESMILRKGSYRCDLTSLDDSGITIRLGDCGSEITIEVDIILVEHSLSIIESVNVPSSDVLQIYGNMLAQDKEESKEKFCDIELVAIESQENESPKQVKFYAHKAILAARSPVFAKMFSHSMRESETSKVDLPDIEPAVLKELLTYIYTNECPELKRHAPSLLYSAEKYELNHLKALCEQRLSFDLQIENAAKMLLLADACRAEQLKRNVLLFVAEHGDKVLATKEWDDVKQKAELLQELLGTVFEPAVKKRKISNYITASRLSNLELYSSSDI